MHNYIIFTKIYVLQEFREKKQKSKKKQKIRLKMKAEAYLAMGGSSYCCDKAKDCCNNRFFMATKNKAMEAES